MIAWTVVAMVLFAQLRADELQIPRIGALVLPLATSPFDEGLREGLREFGYIEGKTIVIEWRRSAGPDEELRKLAADLARSKVQVIVVDRTPATRAVLAATSTIPVVFGSGAPVESGLRIWHSYLFYIFLSDRLLPGQVVRVPDRYVRQGLAAQGYTEGKNIAYDYRLAAASDLEQAARDMVRSRVDLIVAPGTPAALAAKRVSQTVPILFLSADPVAGGLVASLARPGGNATGVAQSGVRPGYQAPGVA